MKKLYFLLLLFLLSSLGINAQITPQIVGGADTDIDEVPWQVLIETNTPLNGILDACGGTIIAPNWILTACHCTFDPANGNPLNVNQIKIYAGITLRSQKNNGQIRNVVEIIRHPDYGTNPDSNSDNDIALLRLSAPLNLNANVQIIDYATQVDADVGWTDPGEVATLSGWGLLAVGGNQPDHLQSIEVPIEDNATAAAQWDPEPGNWDVTNNMIPTGPFATGGSGTCRGDSGGPVVVWDNSNRPILAGIVSYGDPCATGNFLDIHTRVSRYCDWISDEIATVNRDSINCSAFNFTVSNIPADATVNWEVSPSNLVGISSGTGTSANFDQASANSSGETTITFTISGSCGTATVSEDFQVGAFDYVTISGTNGVCAGEDYYFYANVPGGHRPEYTYNWIMPNSSWQVYSQTDNRILAVPYGSNFSGQILVEVNNGCGESIGSLVVYPYCPGSYSYNIYPNPASSEVNITSSNKQSSINMESQRLPSQQSPHQIAKLYDFNGAFVKDVELEATGTTRMDVSNLKQGLYFLKIQTRKEEETYKIIVRH